VERYYAEALLQSSDFGVEGVVDRSAERRAWAQERFGARAYATVEEALAEGNFEAGMVVTPPQTQFAITRALLEKGIPVLTEKPGARNESEANELLSVASGTPLRLGLARHYWRRYSSSYEGYLPAWSIEIETDPQAWGHLDVSQSEGLDGLIDDLLPHAYDIARHVLGQDVEQPAEAFWDGETLRIGFREGADADQSSVGGISLSHGQRYLERVICELPGDARPIVVTSETSLMQRISARLAKRQDEQIEAIGLLLRSFVQDIDAGRTNDDLTRCTRLIAAVKELIAARE